MTITWKGSPNYDTNREPIDRIVIHWFGEGTLESANTRFQNAANQVSAHYGISNTRVWQWVKEEHVAYHCGNYPMNQRSIGIEHDATTSKPASDATYATSSKLVAEISKRHNIPLDRQHVLKHSEVKATQCCGTIDIDRIIAGAKAILAAGTPAPQPPVPSPEPLKPSNQTKLDFGAPLGTLEFGAVRSELTDSRKTIANLRAEWELEHNHVGELTAKIDKQNAIIEAWAKEIDDLEEKLAQSPSTAPISVETAEEHLLAAPRATRLGSAIKLIVSLVG